MNIVLFLMIIILFLFLANNVSAYIDPGTSGMVFGSAWSFILIIFGAIAGFFIKLFFKPIKNMVFKIIKK